MAHNIGLHIIKFPSGKFSYVGSIPFGLGDSVPATKSDVMGGRAFRDHHGDLFAIKFPSFDSRDAAIEYAESFGYKVES